MGGEPYTWRRVSTVRRQAVGNLPPKGGTAPTAEPTSNQQDGKFRFPCNLRQPRRHAAERTGEKGQEAR